LEAGAGCLVPTTQDIAGESGSTGVDLLERGEELARIEQAILWRARTQFEALTRCFLVGSGCTPVLVDQSAEDSVASDRGAERDPVGGVMGWRVLIQTLMRAVIIEMAHVTVKHSSGVSLVVDQQPIGALGADAADKPFRIAVRLRRTGRNLRHGDAFGGEDGVESGGELGVTIADQEAEGADLITEVHQQVPGSLGSPGRAR